MATIKAELYTKNEKKNVTGLFKVVLKIGHKSKARHLDLPFKLEKKQFKEGEFVKVNNHPSGQIIANKINKIVLDAKIVVSELDTHNLSIDELTSKVRQEVFQITEIDNSPSINEYSKKLIERRKKKKQGYSVYEDSVKSFIGFIGDVKMSKVTLTNLEDYLAYLRSSGLKNTTYLRTLRAIWNRAIDEELINENTNPFKRFKIVEHATSPRPITRNDIREIEELNYLSGSKLNARNYFLFMFNNMGLNFMDLALIERDRQIITQGGEVYISYTRAKTAHSKRPDSFTIKQSETSRLIIDYYLKNHESKYLFPVLPETTKRSDDNFDIVYRARRNNFNKWIKKVAFDANVKNWKEVTSYTARYSWAQIATDKGFNLDSIGDAFGHEERSTTRIYSPNPNQNILDLMNEKVLA